MEKKYSLLKKKGVNFRINCYAANHAYPLVQAMITNNQGWGETLSKDNWDMAYIWHTTNEIEILDILTT